MMIEQAMEQEQPKVVRSVDVPDMDDDIEVYSNKEI